VVGVLRALRLVVVATLVLAAAIGTVAVAGCARKADRGGPLTDIKWVLDSYALKGASKTPPPDAAAEITFRNGEASGVVLNTYGGPYTAADDGSLKIGPLASTEMAGPPEVMAFEEAYFKALGNVASYSSDGQRLALYDKDGVQLLAYSKSTASIVGDWRVVAYNNGKGAVTSVSGAVINAAFDDAGRLSGRSGVNSYNGNYTADAAGEFVVGPLVTTKMAGPTDLMEQETAYLAALESARRYELSGSTMTLFRDDGATAVQMTRAGN
jgi:heat shock protein HslJ